MSSFNLLLNHDNSVRPLLMHNKSLGRKLSYTSSTDDNLNVEDVIVISIKNEKISSKDETLIKQTYVEYDIETTLRNLSETLSCYELVIIVDQRVTNIEDVVYVWTGTVNTPNSLYMTPSSILSSISYIQYRIGRDIIYTSQSYASSDIERSGPVREIALLSDATGHLREEAELLDANVYLQPRSYLKFCLSSKVNAQWELELFTGERLSLYDKERLEKIKHFEIPILEFTV